jgi:hypothetical protein
MGPVVYILGSLTCLISAILLLRGYFYTQTRLLLWSGICFSGLAISNAFVFLDLVTFPQIDLFPVRLITTAVAMVFLLYGLIWESR